MRSSSIDLYSRIDCKFPDRDFIKSEKSLQPSVIFIFSKMLISSKKRRWPFGHLVNKGDAGRLNRRDTTKNKRRIEVAWAK